MGHYLPLSLLPNRFWFLSSLGQLAVLFLVCFGLGRESLWTQIAGINGIIIVATFAVAFLVLPIDFDEVGWIFGIVIIAGYGMALVVSFIVTRPLRILAESTQAIGEQNLSERVPIEGAREIRELAQSFNGMVEALQAAETAANNCWPMSATNCAHPLTVLQSNLRAILDDVHDPDKEQMFTLYSQTRQLHHLVDDLHDIAQADAHQLPLDKTDINMITLIAQAGELFEPLALEDGIALHTSTPEQTPDLLGDRNRMIQVLQNSAGEWAASRPQSD